jgi:hypothetical protein
MALKQCQRITLHVQKVNIKTFKKSADQAKNITGGMKQQSNHERDNFRACSVPVIIKFLKSASTR